MEFDMSIITQARESFNDILFDPLQNHIVHYNKNDFYASAIWGAVFFEAFLVKLAEDNGIDVQEQSLNNIISKLKSKPKYLPDGLMKHLDAIRMIRNGLVHHTDTRKTTTIKVDADTIYDKLQSLLQWYFINNPHTKNNQIAIEETNQKMVNVFVSTISPHTIEQVFFQQTFFYKLRKEGINPVRVVFDDFDKKDPLAKVQAVIQSCAATIVLGLERSHAYFLRSREGSPKEKEETHIIHSSGWLHIEAGISYALGHKVFVLCESKIVSDGIFDRDWNSFPVVALEEMDPENPKITDFIKHVSRAVKTEDHKRQY